MGAGRFCGFVMHVSGGFSGESLMDDGYACNSNGAIFQYVCFGVTA